MILGIYPNITPRLQQRNNVAKQNIGKGIAVNNTLLV